MANYGDVALSLKPDWNRGQYIGNEEWMLYTIGHADGVADVHLTAEPDRQHQFRWIDSKEGRTGVVAPEQNEFTQAKMRGFVLVNKDEWTKAEHLWGWDAEGHIQHAGQLLLARPKEKWIAENNQREGIFDKNRADVTADAQLDDAPSGLIALGADGEVKRRPGRPRKSGM